MSTPARLRLALFAALGILLLGAASRAAEPATPAAPEQKDDSGEQGQGEEEGEDEDSQSFVLPPGAQVGPPFVVMGYIDVGFARAGGDGTSFPRTGGGMPLDYGVDTFAPMVNSRGDVASIDAGDRMTNGFLPRSVNIANRPSFLLNTLDLDLRYQAPQAPVLAFARVQLLPRWGGDGRGNQTTLYIEQAFGRVTPFEGRELFISAGKFDSVFGIEYLESQANYRTGVTPSLIARYTTGTSLGVKAFYRQQLPALWSALSLNVAATNSGNVVEALQPPDASLTGAVVLSARLGYELDLPALQIKLGASGLRGLRNDQHGNAPETMYGLDARLTAGGLSLAGEYLKFEEEGGKGAKQTGAGGFGEVTEFYAHGFWGQAAYAVRLDLGGLRAVTGYGRYEQRNAWFEDHTLITVARVTVGLRFDLWECLILKGEVLLNQELEGAPLVDNDVLTSSVVYTW